MIDCERSSREVQAHIILMEGRGEPDVKFMLSIRSARTFFSSHSAHSRTRRRGALSTRGGTSFEKDVFFYSNSWVERMTSENKVWSGENHGRHTTRVVGGESRGVKIEKRGGGGDKKGHNRMKSAAAKQPPLATRRRRYRQLSSEHKARGPQRAAHAADSSRQPQQRYSTWAWPSAAAASAGGAGRPRASAASRPGASTRRRAWRSR